MAREKGYFLLTIFFLVVLVGMYVLLVRLGRPLTTTFSFSELSIMTLATFRLTRLLVYDKIAGFFRNLFVRGAWRPVGELLGCSWCTSLWVAPFVVFFYLLAPAMMLVYVILAISGVATFAQLVCNYTGWSAESKKIECRR